MLQEALNMTNTIENLKQGTAAIKAQQRGAGYKKGVAAVNLAAAFGARGINIHDGQNQQ